jgi:hypothetical protein
MSLPFREMADTFVRWRERSDFGNQYS